MGLANHMKSFHMVWHIIFPSNIALSFLLLSKSNSTQLKNRYDRLK